MKKKLVCVLLAVVCIFAFGFSALACGDDDPMNGTYYMYSSSGSKITGTKYVLDDGEIKVKVGSAMVGGGSYQVDGENITLTIMGITSTGKIVSDGVIKYDSGEYLCKDGKTPPKN